MDEIFPNLRTDLYIQVHESNRSSYYFNSKQSSPRHIIMKLSQIKDKERILKGTGGGGGGEGNLQRNPD